MAIGAVLCVALGAKSESFLDRLRMIRPFEGESLSLEIAAMIAASVAVFFVLALGAKKKGPRNHPRATEVNDRAPAAPIDRRELFRELFLSPVEITPLDSETRAPSGPPQLGLLRDISGGGARFFADLDVPIGADLELSFPLRPKEEPLRARGRIVRIGPAGAHKAEIAIEFCGLSENDRQRIVRRTFELQLRYKREKSDLETERSPFPASFAGRRKELPGAKSEMPPP